MDKTRILKTIAFLLATFLLLVIVPCATFAAQESSQKEGWEFDAELYIWGASIGGTSTSGDEIDISFGDLAKNLDFGFMTVLGARKDKWTFMVDVIYLNVGDGSDKSTGEPGVVLSDVRLKGWIVTPAVGYSLIGTEKVKLDVLAGARYLWLDSVIKFDTGPPQPVGQQELSGSGNVWDGIVGVKGKVILDKTWYVPFLLDVGTGDSQVTWQALAGVGYKFKKVDVSLGYRYIKWNFDDNKVFDDLDLSGPYVGVTFSF
jgi:hypothetical protein